MTHTDVIVIGAGQAGLAMSRHLVDRGIDHVVLERGRVAERWRSERWDSLHLLTPRWQSRLPGWSYLGPDPDGYMTRTDVTRYLEDYARSFSAPLHTGATVEAVERDELGFRVETTAGAWRAGSVVIAAGHCDRATVPPFADALAPDVAQVVPTAYRHPGQLADGPVLVVGASSTGIQLASEIAQSGRDVTLAVGGHTRLPRQYRGLDIMAWLDTMGVLTETAGDVRDVAASREEPSLQLIGDEGHRSLDLGVLQAAGVRIVGRVLDVRGRQVSLADDLAASIAHAEAKMHRLLDRVDRFIETTGMARSFPEADRPGPVPVPASPATLDLGREGIRTVLWATGYRREYSWLRVPVLDDRGELRHEGGITPVPGLYALGLYFMRRRNSSFLDGVGTDAGELAHHIQHRLRRRRPVAA
jgi:putative flavoprotein involved in K+ transport